MEDSLEDRIHRAGKHDEFVKACRRFEQSRKTRAAQQDFYDELERLGAMPEEADEYVNLFLEDV